MTRVIELLGGPGCGKSTLAAELFYRMKRRGVKVELVREWVKKWAWEDRKIKNTDQYIIFASQLEEEKVLYGKVDYIITDSPIYVSPFYAWHYTGNTDLIQAMDVAYELAERYPFFLSREKAYQQEGRYETEEQARDVDREMKEFMYTYGPAYVAVDAPDEDKAQFILKFMKVIP